MEIRKEYAVNTAQMPLWEKTCKRFAAHINATFLACNETSCCVMYQDGSFGHIYIDEMKDFLDREKKGETRWMIYFFIMLLTEKI